MKDLLQISTNDRSSSSSSSSKNKSSRSRRNSSSSNNNICATTASSSSSWIPSSASSQYNTFLSLSCGALDTTSSPLAGSGSVGGEEDSDQQYTMEELLELGGRGGGGGEEEQQQHTKSYEDYLSEVAQAPTSPPPYIKNIDTSRSNSILVASMDADDDNTEELLIDDNDGDNDDIANIGLLKRHSEIMAVVQSTPKHNNTNTHANIDDGISPVSKTITVVHKTPINNNSNKNKIFSPFSPVLLLKKSTTATTAVDQDQEHVSLSNCRKVSVVVRVESLVHSEEDEDEELAGEKSHQRRKAAAAAAASKVCLFPLVLPPTTTTRSNKDDEDGVDDEDDGSSPASSSPSAKSAAFWKQLEEEDGDDDNEHISTDANRSPKKKKKNQKSSSSSSKPDSNNNNKKKKLVVPLDKDNIEYSTRDIIVVNPTAFGKDIPSEITLERARLVSQVARQSSVEDWIRSYRFAQVIWPNTAATSDTKKRQKNKPTTGTAAAAATSTRTTTAPAPTTTTTPSTLIPLCQAIASDLCQPASISVRTVISVGHALAASTASGDDDDEGNTTATAEPILLYSKTTTLFGTVTSHGSVAKVLTTKTTTDEQTLHSFGLVGLTAHRILQKLADSNTDESLTLSVLEIDQQDDALYDLQKTKPFHPHHHVSLRYNSSGTSNDGGGDTTATTTPPSTGGTVGGGATLHGLLDHPVDSLKAVGRCLRRALSMAYHPKRNQHHGSILAILKVWRTQPDRTLKCTSMAQFLDLAQAPTYSNNDSTGASSSGSPRMMLGSPSPLRTSSGGGAGIGNPNLSSIDDLKSPTKQIVRRNAAVRQSLTALGGILRRLLLQEAGNDTILSWRDYTITRVLQKSFQQTDSKIVVLANVSPRVEDYEPTLSTLRYVHGIYTSPNSHNLLGVSPFQQQQSNSKSTSPTSQSLTDDDDDDAGEDVDPLSFGLGFETDNPSSLLRQIVGDPRQRMAKLMPKRKRRVDDNGVVLDVGDNSYTPTKYTGPPDELDKQPQQQDIGAGGNVDGNVVDGNALPTPLVNNQTMDQYWTDPVSGAINPPVNEEETGEGLEVPLETSLFLDAMERGGGGGGGHSDEEPSPLTADTREQFFKAQQQQQRMLHEQEGAIGQRQRSMSQQMEDLSLELREKTLLTQTRDFADDSALQAELEQLLHHIETKDQHIRELTESLQQHQQQLESVHDRNHQQAEYEEVLDRQLQELQSRDEQMALLQEELERARAKITDDADVDKANNEEQEKLRHELECRNMQIQQLQESVEESQRFSNRKHEIEKEQLQHQLHLVDEQLKRRDQDVKQLQNAAQNQSEEMSSKLAADNDEKRELKRQLDLVNSQLEGRDQELQQLKESSEEIQELRRELERNTLEHDQIVSDRETLEKEALSQHEHLNDELSRLRQVVVNRDEELSHLRGAVEKRDIEYEDSMAQLVAQMAAERDEAELESNKARQALQTMQQEHLTECSRWEEEMGQLQHSLESIESQRESHDAQVRALEAERERAELVTRQAQQQLHEEREKAQLDQGRRDEELERLRDQLEVQQEQLQDEQRALMAERDDAIQEARAARDDLETEMQDYRSALLLREEELQDLQATLEKTRAEQVLSREELVQELTVQRNEVFQDAQAARQQYENELQSLQVEVESRDEQLLQLQATFDAAKHQYEKSQQRDVAADQQLLREVEELRQSVTSRDDHIAELQEFTDKARRQYQQAKEELENGVKHEQDNVEKLRAAIHELEEENEHYRLETSRRQEEVRHLSNTIEMMKYKLESAQQELKAERMKSDHASHSSQQLLNLELEGYQLELSNRDEEIAELKERLERAKLEHQQWKEDTKANVLAEIENASNEVAELQRQAQDDAQELSNRNDKIHELEASIQKLQSEVAEALNLADEAIASQSETETKAAQLEQQVSSLRKANQDLESVNTDLAQQVQALKEIEQECDRLTQSESDRILDIESLANKLEQIQQELLSVTQEKDELVQELQLMETARQQEEADLHRQLTEKDENYKQRIVELERGHQLSNDQEISRLQEELAEAEKAIAGSRERYKELEQKMETELKVRNDDLENRLSDVQELSSNLNRILEEKEEAVSKVGNLKQALAQFQDLTRSKVETFVHHRTETKVLLEKTLEENQALVDKNNELQLALDEFRRTTTATNNGDGRDDLLLMLKKAREENIELGKTIRNLQEQCIMGPGPKPSYRLGAASVTDTSHLRRVDSDAGDSTASMRSREFVTPYGHLSAEALLRKTLQDNAILAAENRKLHSSLRGVSNTSTRRQSRVMGPGDDVPPPGPDEMVAGIALAAKRSVERSNAERNILREELINTRVKSLEIKVGSRDYDDRGVMISDGPDKYEALAQRVRNLERRVG